MLSPERQEGKSEEQGKGRDRSERWMDSAGQKEKGRDYLPEKERGWWGGSEEMEQSDGRVQQPSRDGGRPQRLLGPAQLPLGPRQSFQYKLCQLSKSLKETGF